MEVVMAWVLLVGGSCQLVGEGYDANDSTYVEMSVRTLGCMDADVDVAGVAGLLADPTRVAMLDALHAGRALSAGELARVAGVAAPTASAHLRRLLDGGLVAVETQGRHRYYRLAGPAVVAAVEALSVIARPRPVRSLRQSQRAQALRFARTCYDHLAGVVGVAVADALLRADALRPSVAATTR
jgi:DNA-binding transcriptional ArsR family regulator